MPRYQDREHLSFEQVIAAEDLNIRVQELRENLQTIFEPETARTLENKLEEIRNLNSKIRPRPTR